MSKKQSKQSDDQTTSKEELAGLIKELSQQKSLADIPLFFGDDEDLRVEVLPTGVASIDAALDGGFGFGRVTILIGEFSSGKTLLSYFAIRQAQARGLVAAFIDIERSYDPVWASALGINVHDLLVARPLTGEQAWDLLEEFCKRKIGVVVADSIAQMIPTNEAEESMDQSFMGLQARMVNKGLRKIVPVNDKTAVILINQLRSSIGVTYGNPETLPGGRGQRFVAHQIVRVRRGPWIEEGTGEHKHRIGYELAVRVEKSKMGAPWKEGKVPFYFTGMIDEIGGIVPLAIDLGLVTQDGAWYTLPNGERIYGQRKLLDSVRESTELQELLKKGIEEVPDY